jgi:hypothetical protein
MKQVMASILEVLAMGTAGCSGGPHFVEMSPDLHVDRGLPIAVAEVRGQFGGFDSEAVRQAFVARLSEIGFRVLAIRTVHGTPARSALEAREAGADSTLVINLDPSDRPIHPRDPEDAFGRTIAPAPLPGRWFWIRVRIFDRQGKVAYRAESELKEAGLRPRDLATRMLRPLEE